MKVDFGYCSQDRTAATSLLYCCVVFHGDMNYVTQFEVMPERTWTGTAVHLRHGFHADNTKLEYVMPILHGHLTVGFWSPPFTFPRERRSFSRFIPFRTVDTICCHEIIPKNTINFSVKTYFIFIGLTKNILSYKWITYLPTQDRAAMAVIILVLTCRSRRTEPSGLTC